MKIKAEGDVKRLRDQLEEKIQALRGKMTELDEYKKAAEGKLFELEAKVKEYAAKFGTIGKERAGLVTVRGNPLTLIGPEVKAGDLAPDFRVLDGAMKIVTLDAFGGNSKSSAPYPRWTPRCVTPRRIVSMWKQESCRRTLLCSPSAWICPLLKIDGAPPPAWKR